MLHFIYKIERNWNQEVLLPFDNLNKQLFSLQGTSRWHIYFTYVTRLTFIHRSFTYKGLLPAGFKQRLVCVRHKQTVDVQIMHIAFSPECRAGGRVVLIKQAVLETERWVAGLSETGWTPSSWMMEWPGEPTVWCYPTWGEGLRFQPSAYGCDLPMFN